MGSDNPTINDDVIYAVRQVIDRLIHDGKVISRSDSSIHNVFPVAVNAAEGEALRSWVIKEKAAHTIEIGFAYGLATLYICEGLLMNGDKAARHVVLDPYQAKSFKNCGLQSLDEAKVANMVEYYEEESQLALPRFVSEGRQFDFGFVDGSHLFDRVFLDLMYLGRLVRPGGVIFADDYQAQALQRAVSFCLKNLGWRLEDMASHNKQHQWVVLRTAIDPIPRSYPHFVDF